jgi:ferredoxin
LDLIVHSQRCVGHGRCYSLAPGLLTDDDQGYPSGRDEPIVVPDDQVPAARQAAAACPQGAVELLGE